jgi:hypothetical protein
MLALPLTRIGVKNFSEVDSQGNFIRSYLKLIGTGFRAFEVPIRSSYALDTNRTQGAVTSAIVPLSA